MRNLGFSEDKLMQHYLILPNLGNVLACLTAIADYDLTGIQLFTDFIPTVQKSFALDQDFDIQYI